MGESTVVKRPLKRDWWPQLQVLFEERYDDPEVLQEILAELLFLHRSGAMRLREAVVERLVEMSDDTFAWPTTEAPGGDGSLAGDEWPQMGMLAYLGYHVGQNGVRVESRREILDLV